MEIKDIIEYETNSDIKELELEIKYFKSRNLYLAKYNKEINDLTNTFVRNIRSVIFSKERKKLLAMSPNKSDNVDKQNFKYISDNWNNILVEEFIDGTMINLFYNDGKWCIATRSFIGGDNTWVHTKTFGIMFEEAFKYMKISYDIFDKNISYTFVLMHPNNRIVYKYFKPTVKLVQAVLISENNDVEYLDYHKIGQELGIATPDILLFDNLNEALNKVKTLPFYYQGYVLKICNSRYKIRNKLYNKVKKIRGNTASIETRYIELRKENKVKDFLNYYKEYSDKCQKIKTMIHTLTSDVYFHYKNFYLFKNKDYVIPTYFKKICENLYDFYHIKKVLHPKNFHITYKDTIFYINQLNVNVILSSINKIYCE